MAGRLEHLSEDDLEHEVVALAAVIDDRVSRWLAVVGEFDRRRSARRHGFSSTAKWLTWRCGISPRAAREHVRVARRLRDLPRVAAAFADGELSYSKVRAVTRAADHEEESQLLELARAGTAVEVEQAVRSLRSSPSADVGVANLGHARRRLDWWWDDDGTLRISGRLSPDDGAAFIEAIETAADALHPPGAGTPDGAPSPPARYADALAEMAASGSPRTQVVLHVDAAALACTAMRADERAGQVCVLEHGPAVPSETARRLSCDGEVTIAAPSASGALDHGRRRRVVSPALRTSLERRDRRCRFPGCARRHGLHAHHLTHWAHGGPTDRENLVLLCRFHHRLVHEEGFSIHRRSEGTFECRRPDGSIVPERPPPVPREEVIARRTHPPPKARAA